MAHKTWKVLTDLQVGLWSDIDMVAAMQFGVESLFHLISHNLLQIIHFRRFQPTVLPVSPHPHIGGFSRRISGLKPHG